MTWDDVSVAILKIRLEDRKSANFRMVVDGSLVKDDHPQTSLKNIDFKAIVLIQDSSKLQLYYDLVAL